MCDPQLQRLYGLDLLRSSLQHQCFRQLLEWFCGDLQSADEFGTLHAVLPHEYLYLDSHFYVDADFHLDSHEVEHLHLYAHEHIHSHDVHQHLHPDEYAHAELFFDADENQ